MSTLFYNVSRLTFFFIRLVIQLSITAIYFFFLPQHYVVRFLRAQQPNASGGGLYQLLLCQITASKEKGVETATRHATAAFPSCFLLHVLSLGCVVFSSAYLLIETYKKYWIDLKIIIQQESNDADEKEIIAGITEKKLRRDGS